MLDKEYYEPLSDLNVYHIESDDSSYEVRMHYHDGYEVLFFDSANAQFLVDITPYNMVSGDVLYIRPYTMHTAYRINKGPHNHYYLKIAPAILEHTARQLGLSEILDSLNKQPFIHLGTDQDETLRSSVKERFASILRQYNEGNTYRMQTIPAEIMLLLTDIWSASTANPQNRKPTPYNSNIRQILEYVDRHLIDGVSLDALEDVFFLSRHYICRMFKKHTGLTVTQYINRRKIIIAQQVLNDPEAKVSDACYSSGFEHMQYFSKVFKEIIGVAPSQYKRLLGLKRKPEN